MSYPNTTVNTKLNKILFRHALIRVHNCGAWPARGNPCGNGCRDAEMLAGCLQCCFEADPTEGNTRNCFDNHEHTTNPDTRCDVAWVLYHVITPPKQTP